MKFCLYYVKINKIIFQTNLNQNRGVSAKKSKTKIKQRKKECTIGKLLDPKIDYVFKRIFGHIGNEQITTGLISSILKREVSDLRLDCNPILEKDMLDDKVGILDIKAKIDNTLNCDIEMQVVDRKNIEKRILFYWSKMYNISSKEGYDYDKLEKGIVILITDYELDGLKEIEKYVTKWNIREEEYQKIVLTDVMEIYIIELPKFEKYKEKIMNDELNLWVKFIKDSEVVKVENDGNIEKTVQLINEAKKVLEEISQDEHERYLAELRQKYIMDQKAIADAGFDKGLKSGIEQGIQQNTIDIAKKMKEQNIDIEIISKVTGLTVEEIKNLK